MEKWEFISRFFEVTTNQTNVKVLHFEPLLLFLQYKYR